jgi:hypothetical protein
MNRVKARKIAVRLLVAAVSVLTLVSGSDSQKVKENLSGREWHEDLEFYARELPQRHIKPFHFSSQAQFEAAVHELDNRLDHADFDEALVGFMRLSALIGDGHTTIGFPKDWDGRTIFPLFIGRFDNEYRVIVAHPDVKQALGARVTKIGDLPIEQVIEKLRPLAPQDELPEWTSFLTTASTNSPRILHGLGVLPTHDAARYTLITDAGDELVIEAKAVRAEGRDYEQWPVASQNRPISAEHPDEKFYFRYIPEARTLYCNVREMRNLREPGKSLIDYLKSHRSEVDKLVIDLRQNGGGDYFEGLKHLVHPIRELPWINQKGHLFVLIGARTFSAAMANATHFRAQTNAVLVGTPIGEKPNSYSERRSMTLPNSHLQASYSVRWYEFSPVGENIVRPDQEVRRTWADFKAGLDPALQWAVEYKAQNGAAQSGASQ